MDLVEGGVASFRFIACGPAAAVGVDDDGFRGACVSVWEVEIEVDFSLGGVLEGDVEEFFTGALDAFDEDVFQFGRFEGAVFIGVAAGIAFPEFWVLRGLNFSVFIGVRCMDPRCDNY